MSDSVRPHGLYSPWDSPGQNTGVGSLSLLQGIFLTQELNQGLPHCRQILYQLSYQGSLCITSFDLFDNNVFWNNFLHVSYAWDSLIFLALWVYTFY